MSNLNFVTTADLISELHNRFLKQQHAMQCMSESYSRLKAENLELAHEVNSLSDCLLDLESEASAQDLEP